MALQLRIGGVDRSNVLQDGTLQINDELGGSTTCSFQLKDQEPSTTGEFATSSINLAISADEPHRIAMDTGAAGGPLHVYLPVTSDPGVDGVQKTIRRIGGYDVTIHAQGGDTVNGAATLVLTSDGQTVTLGADGLFGKWVTSSAFRPLCGQQVQVLEGGTVIWAGMIAKIDEAAAEGDDSLLVFDCECHDWNALCDRHLVYGVFKNKTLQEIVTEIAQYHIPFCLENFGTTYVQLGPVVPKIIFNYCTISEAFNSLAEATGYSWYVDHQKEIHFFDRTANPAPFSLSATSGNFRNMRVTTSMERYRNDQIVWHSKGAGYLYQRFDGDGVKRVFDVGTPLAEAPKVSRSDVSTEQTVGVKGVDTGKDWYWEYGSGEITQDLNGVTVPVGAHVTIWDTEHLPLFWGNTEERDEAAISARAALEGTSGYYQARVEDDTIDNNDRASEKALALLRRYANESKSVTFETDEPGLHSGQIIGIEVPLHGLTGSFLISSVRSSHQDGIGLRHQVTAVPGEYMGNWVDFFRSAFSGGATGDGGVTAGGVITAGAGTLSLYVGGTLGIGSDLAPVVALTEARKPTSVKAYVKQAPTGAGLTLKLVVGGADWLTLTIPAGQTSASATPSSEIAANTNVRLDITAVGTTFPGSDLSVFLYF